jgi:hypothetical protein
VNQLLHEIEAFMGKNHPKVAIIGTNYLSETNTILLRGRRVGDDGSIRFVVKIENNQFVDVSEITTTERKRLGRVERRQRRGQKNEAK